ncbi:hypothetical protein [Larkinella arboricola]|uniref:Uncharacterized protein n=1 Tax=Larkinella arboricola TaxID=643671 RepID=A0A327WTB7_LARAB|nr:hypothetical protein [Larkinella arboricola]RAJ95878.1 hypothetical protein LX87_03628 [Larkinella arboricola]
MKNLLLLLLLPFLSCQDEPTCEKTDDEATGIIIGVLSNRVALDPAAGDLGREGIRISTSEDYQRLFANCCNGHLGAVNFNESDVLGLSTVNRGCSSSYQRNVRRDDANKRIVYTVTELYCKQCSPTDGQGNFVIIPKVPGGYTVEYVRKQ